jgi:cell division protein FtsB
MVSDWALEQQEKGKHEAEIELLRQENTQLKTILRELKNYIESL